MTKFIFIKRGGSCYDAFAVSRPPPPRFQINSSVSDRLIKKTQNESGAIPVMKPLAEKSTAVFIFSTFEMYTYKSMISHKTTNGILVNFEKFII